MTCSQVSDKLCGLVALIITSYTTSCALSSIFFSLLFLSNFFFLPRAVLFIFYLKNFLLHCEPYSISSFEISLPTLYTWAISSGTSTLALYQLHQVFVSCQPASNVILHSNLVILDAIWASLWGLFYRKFFWDFIGGTLQDPGGLK